MYMYILKQHENSSNMSHFVKNTVSSELWQLYFMSHSNFFGYSSCFIVYQINNYDYLGNITDEQTAIFTSSSLDQMNESTKLNRTELAKPSQVDDFTRGTKDAIDFANVVCAACPQIKLVN